MDNEPKTHGSAYVPAKLRKKRDPGLTRPAVVRVRAAKDKYLVLKHGVTRQGFIRDDINQSVEWPNDTFTQRRLKEGSVVLDEESAKQVKHREEERQREPKSVTSRVFPFIGPSR